MMSKVAFRFRPMLAPVAVALALALPPGAVGAAPSTFAYVTMRNGVAVIDTATQTLVETVAVCSPDTPAAMAVAVLGSRLYVPCLTEGVVKVVDRNPKNVVATIQLPPGSLHPNSGAAITLNGAQVYINTKQGVSVIDTTTNAIVDNMPLGPVSALDVGPNQTYVQLGNGQIMPLSQVQASPADPNYSPSAGRQPIVHSDEGSAWISGNTIIGDTAFDVLFPTDDPYLTPVSVGGGPDNQVPISGNQVSAFTVGHWGAQGDMNLLVADGADVHLVMPGSWEWVYNLSLPPAPHAVQAAARLRANNAPQTPIAADDPHTIVFSASDRVTSMAIDPATQYAYTVEADREMVEVCAGCTAQIGIAGARTVTIPSPTVRVTIDSSPSGQSFSLAGARCPAGSYVSPRSLAWQPSYSCTVTFNSPSPAPGTRLVVAGSADGSASLTINTPAVDTTYTAVLKTQYQLTGISSPAGSGSIAGTGYYNAGSAASIVATPAAGYLFSNWAGPVASPSSASTTVLMNAPVTLTANFQVISHTGVGNVSGQYSDRVTLNAVVGPPGAAFTGAIQFQVNGSNAGPAIPITGSGTYTTPYDVGLAAGSYPITANLTSASSFASSSSGAGTLLVTKEDMTIVPAPTNPQLVPVGTPGGRVNSITITGQLQQAADGFPGNTGLANPTVTLVPAGTGAIPCPVVSASGHLTATCQNVPVGAYTVRWQVTGDYYTAPAVNAVLAVYDPSQPFVAGTGRVAGNGGWANFAVSVNFGSPVPTGGITCVEPSSTGDVVVASTSVRTVQQVDSTRVLIIGTATINGAGAYDFVAEITGNGSHDLFGLQVPGSDVSFPPAALAQGDIQVR